MAFTIIMMIALMIAVANDVRDTDAYINKRNKQHSHTIVDDDTDKDSKDNNKDNNKQIPNGIIPIEELSKKKKEEDNTTPEKKEDKIPNGIITDIMV